jgi:hypothetical protein
MFEDRAATISEINKRQIPKGMIASLCGVPRQRVSEFIHSHMVSEQNCENIKQTVSQISLVWETWKPYKILFSTPAELKSAVATAQMQKAFSQVPSK